MDDNKPPRQQPLQYERDPYDPLNDGHKTPWITLTIIIVAGLVAGFGKIRGWW